MNTNLSTQLSAFVTAVADGRHRSLFETPNNDKKYPFFPGDCDCFYAEKCVYPLDFFTRIEWAERLFEDRQHWFLTAVLLGFSVEHLAVTQAIKKEKVRSFIRRSCHQLTQL